jgi:hypothetical protein
MVSTDIFYEINEELAFVTFLYLTGKPAVFRQPFIGAIPNDAILDHGGVMIENVHF